MKTIEIENGEIRVGYEFKDLSEEAKEKVINDQIVFEIETMNEDSPYFYLAEKMERMQTPWFLGGEIYDNHKNDIIEMIEINNYLFDEDGNIIPLVYYINEGGKIEKIMYKRKYSCTIKNRN